MTDGTPSNIAAQTARIAILGNSGGGKSTLSRRLAKARRLPLVELDTLLWRPGWRLAPAEEYARAHGEAIAGSRWIIEGLGLPESIPDRVRRASEIVLIDMPFEVHIELATARNARWQAGLLAFPPAELASPPPLSALLHTMEEVDRNWMPKIRQWVEDAEAAGSEVTRIATLAELDLYGALGEAG